MDEQSMKALEKWAADEFRSLNGQIEYILSQALKNAGRASKKRKEINNSNFHLVKISISPNRQV